MSLSQGGETLSEASAKAIWGWLTILPPLLAIRIALISRQVIPSLVLGIYIGAARPTDCRSERCGSGCSTR
ncbi:hypothetical protein BH24ACT20_BH24ACT20_05610 [soil metagenome]|jgi:hypothetical protein